MFTGTSTVTPLPSIWIPPWAGGGLLRGAPHDVAGAWHPPVNRPHCGGAGTNECHWQHGHVPEEPDSATALPPAVPPAAEAPKAPSAARWVLDDLGPRQQAAPQLQAKAGQ